MNMKEDYYAVNVNIAILISYKRIMKVVYIGIMINVEAVLNSVQ